jgi:proline dehydrogenase
MSVFDRALVRALPMLPRGAVRAFASPYIAGASLDDACAAVAQLNVAGKAATIDVLGEEIASAADARTLTEAYLDVFDAIRERELDANVSVKPTALGLKLNSALCLENVESLVRRADEQEGFVRMDMEDSSTTDETLRLYRELRERRRERVGIVLQARLRRSLDDIRALADLQPNVRLCKGIYLEPGEIAFTGSHETRTAFVQCAEALLDAGCYVAFATHDDVLIAEVAQLVDQRGIGRDRYEFQMLLGVREQAADALVCDGRRVRVYVPFGERWYEYSLRRLQENPRIATYVAADTVKRVVIPGGRR